jgi:hypothetical protein
VKIIVVQKPVIRVQVYGVQIIMKIPVDPLAEKNHVKNAIIHFVKNVSIKKCSTRICVLNAGEIINNTARRGVKSNKFSL